MLPIAASNSDMRVPEAREIAGEVRRLDGREHLHKLTRALLPAAVLAVAYLVVAPSPADLAAQTFRADLFSSHGYLIWNDYWYSGHSLLGYSLVYPPLGALLGPRLLGALAAVASGALFGLIARRRYGDRAGLAVAWFGAATATNLVSGRITFALGLAVALAAIWALSERRPGWAAALAVLASVTSPVAGLFVAFAAAVAAWVSPGPSPPRNGHRYRRARGDGGRLARVLDARLVPVRLHGLPAGAALRDRGVGGGAP